MTDNAYVTRLRKRKADDGDDDDEKAHTFRKRRLSLTSSSTNRYENDHNDDSSDQQQDVSAASSSSPSAQQRSRRNSVESINDASVNSQTLHTQVLHAAELLDQSPPTTPHKATVYEQEALSPPYTEDDDVESATKKRWQQRHVNPAHWPFDKTIVGTYSCHGIEPVYEDDTLLLDDDDDDDDDYVPDKSITPTRKESLVVPDGMNGDNDNSTRSKFSVGQLKSTSTAEDGDAIATSPRRSFIKTDSASPTTDDGYISRTKFEGGVASVAAAATSGVDNDDDDDYEEDDMVPVMAAKINQDRGGIAYPYGKSARTALFAVYDGHGLGGELVSQFCLTEVQRRLEQHPHFRRDLARALHETFVAVDVALDREPLIQPDFAGTTACVAVLDGTRLTLANVGDSRAVLATRAAGRRDNNNSGGDYYTTTDLTVDQNPDVPAEMDRILRMGGYISRPPGPGLSARVWLDAEQTQVGLAMARSLGDHAVAQVGVVAEPVISYHDLTPHDEFMILASDGVWEFVTSQRAVQIVAAHVNDATKACQVLIEEAAACWHEEEGAYRDDITAIVVRLQHLWDSLSDGDRKKDKTTT